MIEFYISLAMMICKCIFLLYFTMVIATIVYYFHIILIFYDHTTPVNIKMIPDCILQTS